MLINIRFHTTQRKKFPIFRHTSTKTYLNFANKNVCSDLFRIILCKPEYKSHKQKLAQQFYLYFSKNRFLVFRFAIWFWWYIMLTVRDNNNMYVEIDFFYNLQKFRKQKYFFSIFFRSVLQDRISKLHTKIRPTVLPVFRAKIVFYFRIYVD